MNLSKNLRHWQPELMKTTKVEPRMENTSDNQSYKKTLDLNHGWQTPQTLTTRANENY